MPKIKHMKITKSIKPKLFLGFSLYLVTSVQASQFEVDEVGVEEAVIAALKCPDELSEFSEYNLSSVVGKSKGQRGGMLTKSYTMNFTEGGYFGGPGSKTVGDVIISVKVTPPVMNRPGSRQKQEWSCAIENSSISEPSYPLKKEISGHLIKKVINVGTRSEKEIAILVVNESGEEIKLRGKDSNNAFVISKALQKLIDKDVSCSGIMLNKSEMHQAVCVED